MVATLPYHTTLSSLAAFAENLTWFLKTPEEMPLKGIQNIKWMELHDKFRPLVPMDKWTEWEYYHTNLSQEARDEVKKHTRESKKQRKGRVRHDVASAVEEAASVINNNAESNSALI